MVALKRISNELPAESVTGSRNAVVALKPHLIADNRAAGPGKQERRGGIETAGGNDRDLRKRSEAGTPWWH